MKILLNLCLVLVPLVAVSHAAPSRVVLPEYASDDINIKGKEIYESYLGWKRSLPVDSDRSFLDYQRLIDQRELIADQEAEKERRESFGEETRDEPEIGSNPFQTADSPVDDDDSLRQIDPVSETERDQEDGVKRWERKINDWIGSNDKKEYVEDEQLLAEDQKSLDDEKPKIDPSKVATEFGLAEDELDELYRLWLSKAPADEDSSFEAFVSWLNERKESADYGTGSPKLNSYVRWGWIIADWYRNRSDAEETEVDDERQLAEARRFFEEEQQQQINQQEAVRGYEDAEPAVGEIAEREPQEAFASAYDNQNEAGDEFQQRAYDNQNEAGDEFQQRDMERREGEDQKEPEPTASVGPEPQEEPTPDPSVEEDPIDTNGGYSCEENNPCNIENIANEQFYFATASSDKFIQCDSWGGCHTLNCDEGLVWDDQIKTCTIRT